MKNKDFFTENKEYHDKNSILLEKWDHDSENPRIKYIEERWFKKLSSILPKNRKKILDAACGGGYYSYRLAKLGYIVTGVDISKEMIKIAKQKCKETQCNFIVSDIENLKIKSKSMDIVLSFFTLEHTPKPNLFLSQFNRVLKTKGYLIFIVPQTNVYKKIFGKLVYKLSEFIKTKEDEYKPPFHTSFSKKEIKELTGKNGFKVIKFYSGVNFLPRNIPLSLSMNPLILRIERLFSSFNNPFASLIVMCQKTKGGIK